MTFTGGRDVLTSKAYRIAMERECRTFSEWWLRENAEVIDHAVWLQGGKPDTPYGAAMARVFADVNTDRRPGA